MLTKHAAADMEEALSKIIGLKLRHLTRAGNMLSLGFGDDVVYTNYKGVSRVVAEFALHVQSYWKIVSEEKIELTFRDFYSPKDGLSRSEFNSLKDTFGFSRFDERREMLLKDVENEIRVESISASKHGDLKVRFDKGYALEVFADSSIPNDEHWRFFSFTSDDDDFVVFEEDD